MMPVFNANAYQELTQEEKISLHILITREKLGISREDLAKKINITVLVLRSIEVLWHEKTRRNSLKFSEIEMIAKGLGCTIEYLLPKPLED